MRRGHLQASSLSSSPSEESRRDGSTLARAFSCLYFGRFHIIWHIYGRSHRSAWRVFCILFGSPYKYLRSVADPSSQGPEVIGVPLQSFWRSAIYPASLAWILLFCFASLWLDSARSSFFFVKISFFGNRSTFISVMTRCVALIVSNSFLTLSRSFRSPSLLRRAMSRLLLSFANIDFGMFERRWNICCCMFGWSRLFKWTSNLNLCCYLMFIRWASVSYILGLYWLYYKSFCLGPMPFILFH